MKAAVYMGPGDLQIMEVPEPAIGPHDVKIRVEYCGVCGTDLHIYHGDGGSGHVEPGTIIGHEVSGTVVETGSAVRSITVGQRVTVDPNEACGLCTSCRSGQPHLCKNTIGYGTARHGGFAEYIAAPEKQVYVIPDHLPMEAASQCETLSCCIHGMDLTQVQSGQTVLIIGGGPIGQIMTQLASCAGAAKIIVSEPIAEKRELALSLGATHVLDPASVDLQAALLKITSNVDRVLECVGNPTTMEQAIRLAGKKSIVMLYGLSAPDAEIRINPYLLFQKETSILASFVNPLTMDRAIALLAEKRIQMESVITDIVPFHQIKEVFQNVYYRKRGKILIKLTDTEQ